MEQPTKREDYSLEIIDPETGEARKVHNREGAEIPDPVPMAPPLGYTKPMSMFDRQRAFIRAEHDRLRMLELEELQETVEQANDFDVDDDIESAISIYEEKFDPVDYEVRQRLRQAEYRASVEAAVDKLPPQQKELLNGDNLSQRPEQGRSGDTQAGSRKPDQKRENDPKPGEGSPDRGSVSEDD